MGWMPLSLVLDGIGRSSLPGLLATLNDDGTQTPLPRSQCTGVSVARGGKLVLDGQLAGLHRGGGAADPIVSSRRSGPCSQPVASGRGAGPARLRVKAS